MSLTSPLYYEAVHARSQGDEAKARALELAQFSQRHYTPADFMCRGLAKLRHGDWSGWLDFEHRFDEPSYRAEFARIKIMEGHEPWFRFTCDAYGNWTERDGWQDDLGQKTILVGLEGGGGDQMMLARFLPWLAQRAKKVYWLVPVDLERLARFAYGDVVEVIAQEELPAFDRYVMMFSLPAIVGHMVEDTHFPVSAHRFGEHLIPPTPVPLDAVLRKVSGGFFRQYTGLAWAGNTKYGQNNVRSLNHETWQDFMLCMASLNIPLLSFQREEPGSWWPRELNVYQRVIGDWFDTYAALASEVKQVVTVDTGLAHLAGAMGIRTYTMLGFDHCWRWSSRVDGTTLWYPSMRLFRQDRPGDWLPVIQRLCAALREDA